MGALSDPQRPQDLRRGRDPEGHRHRGRGRRVPDPGRALGLRQEHAAEHDRRAGHAHRGQRSTSASATSTTLRRKDRDIAMVFQSYALYPNMNVAQNIAFGLEMRKVPKARARRSRAARGRRCCRSSHLLDRKPGAAVRRPAPARGHGPGAGARPASCSCSTSRCPTWTPSCAWRCAPRSSCCTSARKTTMVYVTHDQVEAMTLGDRIAVMKDGVVQQFGTPDDIYSRPATRFVAEFIGSPAMNMVRAPARRPRPARRMASSCRSPRRSRARWPARGARRSPTACAPKSLLRCRRGLPGTLSMIEPTGPETYVTGRHRRGQATARVPGKVRRAACGEPVHLALAGRARAPVRRQQREAARVSARPARHLAVIPGGDENAGTRVDPVDPLPFLDTNALRRPDTNVLRRPDGIGCKRCELRGRAPQPDGSKRLRFEAGR